MSKIIKWALAVIAVLLAWYLGAQVRDWFVALLEKFQIPNLASSAKNGAMKAWYSLLKIFGWKGSNWGGGSSDGRGGATTSW